MTRTVATTRNRNSVVLKTNADGSAVIDCRGCSYTYRTEGPCSERQMVRYMTYRAEEHAKSCTVR
jgi:hypothetical protein